MATPQDHKKKASPALGEALGLQAANVTMKATLDNVVTKMLVIMRGLKDVAVYSQDLDGDHILTGSAEYQDDKAAEDFLNLVQKTIGLTRAQTAELRSQPAFEYPDEEIQEVLTRAVTEITALLLVSPEERKASRGAQ